MGWIIKREVARGSGLVWGPDGIRKRRKKGSV